MVVILGSRHSDLGRSMKALLAGELSARGRAALIGRIRTDDQARANYDRIIEGFRELEQRPIARTELDLVENWVIDQVVPVSAPSRVGSPWRVWLSMALAVATAVVMVLGPLHPEPDEERWGIRGVGGSALLGVQALCGTDHRALQSMEEGGCPISGTVSFAYRVDASAPPGVLTLFGVDERGEVLYYAPTPADPNALLVRPGPWRPAWPSVALQVNHGPGQVRLYALLAPRSPTIEEVDAMAEVLRSAPPANPGDPPWHARSWQRGLGSLCSDPDRCASAELTFTLHEDSP